jgi:catechol 2,3-dioxygenase-like lactoylglutathione lyase family enzyme
MAAAVLRIGHTGITVSDLERSMRFYRDVLGFEVSAPVQVSGPLFDALTGVPGCVVDVAFARGLGQTIELLSYREPADRRTSTLRSCDPGFWHLCLKVRDIEAVVRAVHASGFAPLSDIQTVTDPPLQGLRAVYVRDPDGVALELLQEPPGVSLEDLHLQTRWNGEGQNPAERATV